MEEIKKRMLFFIVMSCLMFLFSIMANEPSRWIGGLIVLVFVVLSIYEYKKFRLAKLIVDNNIAFIENICIKNTHRIEKETKRIGVYISCFGVMNGSQIIKYNMDGIILKSIVIDNNSICLTREKDDNEIILKVSYGCMAKTDLLDFARHFEYETGVTSDMRL
ncbi:MAG: hypothetical protein K8R73_05560 [Clostridiales bacterium]|nr:hypothetical protein [Clostridiales bacterium]